MRTDTISDMLTRIRNANLAKHQIVQIPATNVTRSIAKVLLTEGFIDSFEELKNGLVLFFYHLNIKGKKELLLLQKLLAQVVLA
jgi:small subunit ribosomal protein S8